MRDRSRAASDSQGPHGLIGGNALVHRPRHEGTDRNGRSGGSGRRIVNRGAD